MADTATDFPLSDGSIAIAFDADNTLWNFDKVLERALERVVVEFERRRPASSSGALSPGRIQSIRGEIVLGLGGETIALEEIRFRSIKLSLLEIGVDDDDLVGDLTRLFFAVRFDELEMFSDVRDVMDGLRRSGYVLGLLTNGSTDPVRCGLPDVFESTIYANERGFPKPDPRAFAMMARELGVPAERLVYVGDSDVDVHGANAATSISVLINRSGRSLPFSGDASFEIPTLRRLARVLELLQQ